MNYSIITPAEADVFLATNEDWIALSDAHKTVYIRRASVFIQTMWTCLDVDFDEDIPDSIKEACAYYALSESSEQLYSSGVNNGVIVETSDTLDVLSSAEKVDYSRKVTVSSYSFPDSLMMEECVRNNSGGSVKAVLS